MRRIAICLIFILTIAHAPAQAIDWKAVDHRRELNIKSWPRFYDVTRAEQAQMRKLILARKNASCQSSDDTFLFNPQPLAPGRRDFLVSCDHDDQAENSPKWIVEFTGGRGRVIGELEGFISHLEPTVSHSLHDIIMSRHTGGACCYALSYYRYDGTQYHLIGAADVEIDANGKSNITPKETPSPR
jgi:hypothetical protein